MNFKEIAEKHKEDFMVHISWPIKNLITLNKEISINKYSGMLMNSYENKLIEPLLSNEALIWKIENALKNSSTRQISEFSLPRHYDEWLLTDGIQELLRRIKNTKTSVIKEAPL